MFLVAMNTVQIADRRWAGMAVVGFAISFVWWSNSSSKRETYKGAGVVYALGAAAGTLCGALIADRWL